jgi:hypothetical protein
MFGAASGLAASNVLSGQIDGLSVTVMDCVVAAGQANFESTEFRARDAPAKAPDFYLAPRDFLSRGSAGIEIPGEPEFNKGFLLRGEDKRAIREAFAAPVIEACPAEKNQNIEARQPLFAIMRRGGRLPLAQYRPFLLNCVRLAKALGAAGSRTPLPEFRRSPTPPCYGPTNTRRMARRCARRCWGCTRPRPCWSWRFSGLRMKPLGARTSERKRQPSTPRGTR